MNKNLVITNGAFDVCPICKSNVNSGVIWEIYEREFIPDDELLRIFYIAKIRCYKCNRLVYAKALSTNEAKAQLLQKWNLPIIELKTSIKTNKAIISFNGKLTMY